MFSSPGLQDLSSSAALYVTDQQTDEFLARNCKKGKSIWIGARQTFDSDNKGSWGWADGYTPWKFTSWMGNFKPDNKSESMNAHCSAKTWQTIQLVEQGDAIT